jgi:hypothetical protein
MVLVPNHNAIMRSTRHKHYRAPTKYEDICIFTFVSWPGRPSSFYFAVTELWQYVTIYFYACNCNCNGKLCIFTIYEWIIRVYVIFFFLILSRLFLYCLGLHTLIKTPFCLESTIRTQIFTNICSQIKKLLAWISHI